MSFLQKKVVTRELSSRPFPELEEAGVFFFHNTLQSKNAYDILKDRQSGGRKRCHRMYLMFWKREAL